MRGHVRERKARGKWKRKSIPHVWKYHKETPLYNAHEGREGGREEGRASLTEGVNLHCSLIITFPGQ
jgi:hypothetical protein